MGFRDIPRLRLEEPPELVSGVNDLSEQPLVVKAGLVAVA